MAVPTAVLLVNLQLQLLAPLDYEFSMRFLPTFEPAPVFHGLFPTGSSQGAGAQPQGHPATG